MRHSLRRLTPKEGYLYEGNNPDHIKYIVDDSLRRKGLIPRRVQRFLISLTPVMNEAGTAYEGDIIARSYEVIDLKEEDLYGSAA